MKRKIFVCFHLCATFHNPQIFLHQFVSPVNAEYRWNVRSFVLWVHDLRYWNRSDVRKTLTNQHNWTGLIVKYKNQSFNHFKFFVIFFFSLSLSRGNGGGKNQSNKEFDQNRKITLFLKYKAVMNDVCIFFSLPSFSSSSALLAFPFGQGPNWIGFYSGVTSNTYYIHLFIFFFWYGIWFGVDFLPFIQFGPGRSLSILCAWSGLSENSFLIMYVVIFLIGLNRHITFWAYQIKNRRLFTDSTSNARYTQSFCIALSLRSFIVCLPLCVFQCACFSLLLLLFYISLFCLNNKNRFCVVFFFFLFSSHERTPPDHSSRNPILFIMYPSIPYSVSSFHFRLPIHRYT